MYHVIIAGGIGSRFWPMSTEHKPKQFLNLLRDKSLIKSTYDRLLKISDPGKIFIVTSEKYKDHIKEQIPNIDNHNIIYEPKPKNTAPAIYLALKHLCRLETNPIVGVYPSDHYIQHENKFYEELKNVFDGFILASVHAIEQRDPSTSGHSERVAKLSVALANQISNLEEGPYKSKKFT